VDQPGHFIVLSAVGNRLFDQGVASSALGYQRLGFAAQTERLRNRGDSREQNLPVLVAAFARLDSLVQAGA
jgi:hypothetical protein